ncbi:hypothetical protein BS50DRAFT_589518 [Corynespora cassiicola Philippines]|uniref:Uncharacterized protein n=1 Tax=Corynespora cassiicola Philippines TaxID=1448308 RepID=A0A2T2NI06_CORCC|nr:hypothetical protein BS50DRAFT_589518 [Corynespora cassiicola Philippines]
MQRTRCSIPMSKLSYAAPSRRHAIIQTRQHGRGGSDLDPLLPHPRRLRCSPLGTRRPESRQRGPIHRDGELTARLADAAPAVLRRARVPARLRFALGHDTFRALPAQPRYSRCGSGVEVPTTEAWGGYWEVMNVFAPRTWNASRVDGVAGEWGGGSHDGNREYGFWRLRLWRAQPVNALATLFHTPQRKGYLPYQGRHASEMVPILRRENCAFLPRPFEGVTMAQLGWLLAEPAKALNYDVRFFAQHGEREKGVREQDIKDYTEAYLMEPWREGSGLCDGEWGVFCVRGVSLQDRGGRGCSRILEMKGGF